MILLARETLDYTQKYYTDLRLFDKKFNNDYGHYMIAEGIIPIYISS